MKTLTIISIILALLIITLGLIDPVGIRAALANNRWSLDFVNHIDPNSEADMTPPPTSHAHAGLLLANQSIKSGNLHTALGLISPLAAEGDPLILDTYADLLYLSGEYQQAFDIWAALDQEVTIEQALRKAQGQGDGEQVVLASQSLYAINPDKFTATLAAALIANGQYDQAAALLNESIQNFPNSGDQSKWFRYLGDAHQGQEQWERAQAAYLQSLAIDPDNQRASRNLSALYLKQINAYAQDGQYELAIEKLQQALAFDEENISFLLRAGQLFEQTGDLEQAADAYQAVLELDPDQAQALKALNDLMESNDK